MTTRRTRRHPRRRHRGRALALADPDADPLTGLANLFDAGMVFALALLVALVSYHQVPELLLDQDEELTILKNPGTPRMEILHREGNRLQRYRLSQDELRGDGQRLGTAYRLTTGEVVYVPER